MSLKLEFESIRKEREFQQKIIAQLDEKIKQEQQYLYNLFDKTRCDGLADKIKEWESMKSITEQLKETLSPRMIEGLSEEKGLVDIIMRGGNQKYQIDYSGVLL